MEDKEFNSVGSRESVVGRAYRGLSLPIGRQVKPKPDMVVSTSLNHQQRTLKLKLETGTGN